MKTKSISVLLLTLLLVAFMGMPLKAAAEGSTPENLLALIYAKNNRGEILKNHRSFTYTEVGGNYDYTYYADADITVKDCRESRGYIRVRTPEFDYCLFTNGTFSRWVHFETDSCDWEGLPEDVLFETIIELEEKDGLLTVTTRPSEATRQRIIENEYAETKDRDIIQMRVVYVLDADTLELLSLTDYDTMPDGTEVCAWEERIAYDIDLPYGEEISAIQAHLDAAKDRRTTTFVFDEGTAYETSYTYSTQIGDGCVMPEEISKDGIPYRIDPDRSTLTNEAKDNDAILYLDRVHED